MKILQVATVAKTIDSFLLPFSKAFKAEGWHVDAAANNIFDFDNVVKNHDNCFEINFCRNPFKLIQLCKSLKQIRLLLIEQKYDVVHVHTPIAAFLTRTAIIGIKNTKIFYTAHGFHYINTNPKWKNVFFYLAEKLAGYKNEHLFVINKDDYDFSLKKRISPKESITFIKGIGVDLTQYQYNYRARESIISQLKLAESAFILLQVAELNSNKNHIVVLEALVLFKEKYPDANITYLIVGEGVLNKTLTQQVSYLNLSDWVLFLGQRNDIPDLLSACDVLTLSSKREGLPRCILEAMCINKPIIASNIRGCTDLLSTGAGILVDYDNPQDWLQAIEKIYLDPELRERMGRKGFQLIEQYYQQNKVVDAVLATYKEKLFYD